MTGAEANMFGLDMIMIRVGVWDILVEWASIVHNDKNIGIKCQLFCDA